jgi:tetratricopeptide (TPR) repeat protein
MPVPGCSQTFRRKPVSRRPLPGSSERRFPDEERMRIEALKQQARRHEQQEEWREALDSYRLAIARLEENDDPDVGLYNRVGDLFVRVGSYDDAFDHYEKAVDLYVEAGLHNNAIAVCKKIIRGLPGRPKVYLRMGQIRAAQGFLSDARTNFLLYAERMQDGGDLDESFRALVELCDLAPEDVDLRVAVGEQLASHERVEEAVQQLRQAYIRLMHDGDLERAREVGRQMLGLAPDADLTVPDPVRSPAGRSEDIDFAASYGTVDLDARPMPAPVEDSETREVEGSVGAGEGLGGVRVEEARPAKSDADALTGQEPEAGLPPEAFLSFEEEEDEVEDPGPELPLLDAESSDEDSDEDTDAAEGALRAGDEAGEAFGEVVQEAMEEARGPRPESPDDLPLEEVLSRIEDEPDALELRQRLLELAYQSGDRDRLVKAFVGLGGALDRSGQSGRAKVSYQQALELDPEHEEARAALGEAPPPEATPVKDVASHEDYVDLGALVLGEQDEKTTRFVVAYQEPTGDEDADFAQMLSQFKEKVSENLDADDVRAHHDLGTAYKEMGLLDEAVAEFQQALRASASHLPTHELLGQTFIEMGKPEAAIRSLQRAVDMDHEVEDELLAIYYYLGRAHEEVGNTREAVDLYDRVFSLDINFADVTDRLRALR